MALSTELRRSAPMNFIFLAILTIAQSLLLGIVSSGWDSKIVVNYTMILVSVGISAAVCLVVTLFAFQAKWDFTMIRGWLIAITTVLLTFGILILPFPDRKRALGFASGAALIFCLYLVYDTQQMVGGKHIFNASPKEYIFAVLNLYLDIIVHIFFILMYIVCYSIGIRFTRKVRF